MGKLTLDIIVTHYQEKWGVGKKFFDSIAIQECVDFDDIGVILVNDGEGNTLPYDCFRDYPFSVMQTEIPKGGVSRARNRGLDLSNADWVMFCDFDDCFSSVFALYMIFCAMHEEKYDTLWSCFTEETKNAQGETVLVPHEQDYVFIHGKAHRRLYLAENNIRFHPKLTIHEDAYFNLLAQKATKPERIAGIKTPIYCWRWNPDSVVRRDKAEDYILLTYDHLMRQRIAITEEFLKREMFQDAMVAIIKTVVDAFYDFQQPEWLKPENKDLVRKAENWFASYLKRYAGLYCKADNKQIAGMVRSCRENRLQRGLFLIEQITMHDWLKHVIEKAKPVPKWEQDI